MCVCKQTSPPYAHTRLCDVNRHGAPWLIQLRAERAVSAPEGFGLRLSPAIVPGRPSIPPCRAVPYCGGAPPRQLPRPPAHRSWERLCSGPHRARFGVGKQNHSSKCTAERGQRKPPANEQHGAAPGTSCPRRQPARGGGARTLARGADPPGPPLHRAPERRGARSQHGAAATSTRTAPAGSYRSQSSVDAV